MQMIVLTTSVLVVPLVSINPSTTRASVHQTERGTTVKVNELQSGWRVGELYASCDEHFLSVNSFT